MSLVADMRPLQDQSEHLRENQIQQPLRHAQIMSDERSPLGSDPGPASGTPRARIEQAVGAGGQLSCRALFSFPCRRHAANTSTTF